MNDGQHGRRVQASNSSDITIESLDRLPSISSITKGEPADLRGMDSVRLPPIEMQPSRRESGQWFHVPTSPQQPRKMIDRQLMEFGSTHTHRHSSALPPIPNAYPSPTYQKRNRDSIVDPSSSTHIRDEMMSELPHQRRVSRTCPSAYATVQIPRRSAEARPSNKILIIRQQPAAARACGLGDRDRRVVDPPPIIEFAAPDSTTQPSPISSPSLSRAPSSWDDDTDDDGNVTLVARCSLYSADGRDDLTTIPEDPSPATGTASTSFAPPVTRLVGTTVSSAQRIRDDAGVWRTFFVFPDLSCRVPGEFRLQFTLTAIEVILPTPNTTDTATTTITTPGARTEHVASILSDVFTVYTAKKFPGMRPNSELLNALRRQGVNVGVRRHSAARKPMVPQMEVGSSGSSESGEGG